jgi:hypothetical protein
MRKQKKNMCRVFRQPNLAMLAKRKHRRACSHERNRGNTLAFPLHLRVATTRLPHHSYTTTHTFIVIIDSFYSLFCLATTSATASASNFVLNDA